MKKLIKTKRIAEALGVNLSTVYRWFDGSRQMTPETAVKLEAITRIKAEAWLLPDKYKNPYIPRKPEPQIQDTV